MNPSSLDSISLVAHATLSSFHIWIIAILGPELAESAANPTPASNCPARIAMERNATEVNHFFLFIFISDTSLSCSRKHAGNYSDSMRCNMS